MFTASVLGADHCESVVLFVVVVILAIVYICHLVGGVIDNKERWLALPLPPPRTPLSTIRHIEILDLDAFAHHRRRCRRRLDNGRGRLGSTYDRYVTPIGRHHCSHGWQWWCSRCCCSGRQLTGRRCARRRPCPCGGHCGGGRGCARRLAHLDLARLGSRHARALLLLLLRVVSSSLLLLLFELLLDLEEQLLLLLLLLLLLE